MKMKSSLFSIVLIAAAMNAGCQTIQNVDTNADIEIILLGDVNLQTGAGAHMDRPDPASAFTNVIDTLNGADLRYCNMEGLYGQTATEAFPEKPGWWHSQSDMLAGMIAARLDVVGLANNASVGDAEILNTISLLDSANIRHVGAGANRATARAPVIITIGDTRFGFLQYTARYYSEDFVATGTTPGVARLKTTGNNPNAADLAEIVADVKKLSSLVDVVFFSHHVRKSGKLTEPYQRKLASAVIVAGVDLVFGHGPHINQGVEIIDGVAVLHSVSNFAFDWWKMADRNDGLLVKVIVRNKKIVRVSFVPVSRDENNNVFLTPPGTTEGDRQINDVQSQSPDVSLTVEGSEVVLPIGVK